MQNSAHTLCGVIELNKHSSFSRPNLVLVPTPPFSTGEDKSLISPKRRYKFISFHEPSNIFQINLAPKW